MVEEEADIEETEATWEDDTQTATNVVAIRKSTIYALSIVKFAEKQYLDLK